MRIMVKTENGWRAAVNKPYDAEVKLQDLLYNDPDLIPFDELGIKEQAERLTVKELGLPGSGATDVLVIDGNGGITLIECKLAYNAEAKRAVVGQLLEYAAHLWRMPVETFEDLVRRRRGKSLTELMGLEGEGLSTFRRALHETLAAGAFTLLVATDALDEQMRRIIEYLSAIAHDRLRLFALEVAYFSDHGVQVAVPHVYGLERSSVPPPRPTWDERKFFEVLQKNTSPEVVAVSRSLLILCTELGEPQWGAGKVDGSFACRVVREDGTDLSVFAVDTSGRLWLNLDPYLTAKKLPPEIVERYRSKLMDNPKLRPLSNDKYSKSFRIKDAFAASDAPEQFAQAVHDLIGHWKSRMG